MSKKTKHDTKISVSISKDQDKRLNDYLIKNDVTKSFLIRKLIDLHTTGNKLKL